MGVFFKQSRADVSSVPADKAPQQLHHQNHSVNVSGISDHIHILYNNVTGEAVINVEAH